MGKYGLPYMGSKSAIADKVIDVLPPDERFIDLFGGGGAMTHAAALSGKYAEVVYSDADPLACEYITRAIRGDYSPERFTPRWISREEFFEKKDVDPYIRYCWSFGNCGDSYLYGVHVEGLKRRLFEWIIYGQSSDFVAGLGVPVDDAPDGGIAKRLAFLKRHIRGRLTTCGTIENPERLMRVQVLEGLTRVQGLRGLARVAVLHRGYSAYRYRAGDVVYCDPPYDSRKKYVIGDFDFAAFMDWAARIPCYISSYEIDDPRFRIYHEFKKVSLFCATKNCAVIERLYASRYAAKEKI